MSKDTIEQPMMHKTGTREEWLTACRELLKDEKEHTRRSDELARRRQELPWVRIDKAYRFETDEGKASLPDLFQGRSQLMVDHFMFGPDWTAGCPSCSAIADGFNGFAVHLANHDVMLWVISRAPLAKLQAYKQRMGWTFPWASSFDADFNFDFSASITEEQQRSGEVEHNFPREAPTSDVFRWRATQRSTSQRGHKQLPSWPKPQNVRSCLPAAVGRDMAQGEELARPLAAHVAAQLPRRQQWLHVGRGTYYPRAADDDCVRNDARRSLWLMTSIAPAPHKEWNQP